ncbi:MAG TPA: DUF4166 domain-containing protein [Gemmatimonadaceae bacterium]|nr:DUF4166 domain-containing protein [Gemmatimonadaceae bacterium]
MSGPSLYRRLLGRDFERLPEALRRFHDSVGGGSGAGVFRVQRGTRAPARAVARALGLPPEGDRVAVTLRVTAENDHEVWTRAFGAQRLRTRQWLEGGRLIERTGAAKLVFDVAADERGMRFRSVGFAWLGAPLPASLAPEVEADVRGFAAHWEVTVLVRAPRLGVITSYQGRITPIS